MNILVTGGARSGKSGYAENLALQRSHRLVYLATGWADDAEMATRIEQHRTQRDSRWHLLEEPINLGPRLLACDQPEQTVLVDCLTLWLSNALHQQCWTEVRQQLMHILPSLHSDIIFVSNEVGSGIVPLGQLSRSFVDESGRLNQQLGQICEQVTLVVAGLPMHLKQWRGICGEK